VTDILKDMSSKLANLVKFIIRIHVSTFWLNDNISCFRKVSNLWLLYLTQIQLSSNKGYIITANFLLNEGILIIDNSIGYVSNLFKLRQKAAGLSHILLYV